MDSEKLNEQWRSIRTQVNSYPDADESQVDAFFSRLEPQAMSDSFLMLTADNDFIKTWVEQNYVPLIQRALLDLTGVAFTVAVAVDPSQEARKAAASQAVTAMAGLSNTPAIAPTAGVAIDMAAPTAAPVIAPTPIPPATSPAPQTVPLAGIEPGADIAGAAPGVTSISAEPETPIASAGASPAPDSGHSFSQGTASALTFSNFVIGESNRTAYSMAMEVAEEPGRAALNPLFIYGKSGLGKTHLMRAVQNYIEETRPNLHTVFVDAEVLANEYAEAAAAHNREKNSFKNFKIPYEQAGVLLIDDVQSLQGKPQTLQIVFQLINTLTVQGKQVVLSADRAPKSIDMDERYQSRFAAGFLVDIQPPNVETKLGIVKSFAAEVQRSEGLTHLKLPYDIQMYIAEASGSNIRELKSAVTKVIYQMSLSGRTDIPIGEVRSLLESHFSSGTSRNLVVEDIQHVVEGYFRVSHDDLVGRGRSRAVTYPRHIAIYLCRQILDIPFNNIAQKFGRDHSTAMHSVKTVENMLAKDWELQGELENLQRLIREL